MTSRSSPGRGGGPPAKPGVEGPRHDGSASGDAPPPSLRDGPPPGAGKDQRSVRLALADATQRIARISPTPRLDAELLMAHALGIARNAMILSHLDDPAPEAFAELVDRRLRHEPVAHLTGLRGFWTIDLVVGPGAFIPRADTETLIEAAVAHFAGTPGPRTILDLGTGPGSLLLAALDQWPDAHGVGVERSDAARAYALRNAERLGLSHRAEIIAGDWAHDIERRFDLVLANPPYVATDEALAEETLYDPAEALFGGRDGLDDYRRIAPQLPRLIAPRGMAAVEIGWTQAPAVTALLEAEGLTVTLRRDLGDRPRCLVVT